MKQSILLTSLIIVVLALVSAGYRPLIAADNSGQPVKILRHLPLGGEGRWDYLLADPDTKRLYVARATRFMIVSTETGELIGEIPDTPGAHGVALAPDLGIGFTSNGQENKVSVFGLKTLKVENKIETGRNPDAILYHRSHPYRFRI